jgi:hypothetical protein
METAVGEMETAVGEMGAGCGLDQPQHYRFFGSFLAIAD